MAYNYISGTIDVSAKIIVVNASTWITDKTQDVTSGSYTVNDVGVGIKLIIAKKTDGEVLSFGNVTPIGNRAITGSGNRNDAATNTIEYITISSTSNSSDFGDLSSTAQYSTWCSNGVNGRGVLQFGLRTADYSNVMEYITINTPSNSSDFGDVSSIYYYQVSGTSNGINNRGVLNGPIDYNTQSNIILYITITSTGNTTDFGDLTQLRSNTTSLSNGINNRGITIGGSLSTSQTTSNVIDYITISSTGNSTDFGDSNYVGYGRASLSNGVNNRGISAGAWYQTPQLGTVRNDIEYITITTLGNATDFGDMDISMSYAREGTSNATAERGLFIGGHDGASTSKNNISYITITTLGDAVDFGDLLSVWYYAKSCSNA